MAGNDESGVGGEVCRDVGDVVNQQGWPAVEIEAEVVGDVGSPREVEVVVAAHGLDGGYLG